MNTRVLTLAVVLFSLVLCVGCGGTDFGEIGKITGKITHKGETVVKGTKVIFMRMDTGYAGFGFTDDEGKYSIEWHRDDKVFNGLPVGTYQVLVEPPGTIDVESLSADQMLAGVCNSAPPAAAFDKKYAQTATSGIEFTIKGGENTCDILLL